MPLFAKGRSFLRNLFSSERVDTDLDQEVDSHLEMLIEENIRAGMPPGEAQRAARIELGGIEQVKEQVREERIGNWLHSVIFDCRYGVRQLRKNPGFAAVAVLTLALGVGATTVMFSVVYNLLFNPFPYRAADRLMLVSIHNAQKGGPGAVRDFSIPDFIEYQQHNRVFEDMVGYNSLDVLYSDGKGTRRWPGAFVTTNSFEFYGVSPLIGRGIEPEDGEPGAAPVFVMNCKLWKAEFNGDPAVLGKSFKMNGTPRTLVGIMPPRFQAYSARVWLPLPLRRGAAGTTFLGSLPASVFAIGRLKDGTTLEAARADSDVIARRLAKVHPKGFPERFTVSVQKVVEASMGQFRLMLYALLGAVVMLLLIACSNVANLLLARATIRARELAVRAAIGASPGRLIRQLLVESLVLALAACLTGCAFTYLGLKGIMAAIPQDRLPGEAIVGLDPVVLSFALAISVLTTLIFGLAPALQAVRGNFRDSLMSTSQGVNGGLCHGRFRGALVIAEVALSVALLVGAGLMARSFFALSHVDLGFNPTNILYARLGFPDGPYDTAEQKRLFFQQVLDRVKALPGVVAVTEAYTLPAVQGAVSDVTVPGKTHSERWYAQLALVSDGYFQTLGLRLLRGRFLSQLDVDSARQVTVVNDTLARQFFANEDPLGRRIKFNGFDRLPHTVHDAYFEIVGVVTDFRNTSLQNAAMPEAILPYTVSGLDDRDILARTTVAPDSLLASVRREIWAVDSNVAVAETGSLKTLLKESFLMEPEFDLIATGAFAGIGLALVVIGVFSVMAYTVSLQTHEIGVRMALGGRQASILKMILAKGAQLIAAGIVIGLSASYALTRFLASQIWGVSVTDPWTFAAVVTLIALVGLTACYIPARRAARVDPMIALRYD